MVFRGSSLWRRSNFEKRNQSPMAIALAAALGLGMALPDSASAHEDEGDAIEMEAGMTWYLQSSSGAPDDGTDLTYTFDLGLSGKIGEHGTAVIAFEAGGGDGIDQRLGSLSTANYDAFVTDLFGLNPIIGGALTDLQALSISQLYYEHEFMDGKLMLDLGKLDIHSLYDDNAYANDETEQFLSGIFTRLAGTVYAELPQYYAPGFAATLDLGDRVDLSLIGASAGGRIANSGYEDFGHRPYVVVQVNFKPNLAGHDGNYRFYAIQDNRVYIDLNGNPTENSAWGVSFDQAVGHGVGLFARYSGQDTDVRENSVKSSWSIGTLIAGGTWGRADDTIGIGYGSVNVNNKSTDFAGDPNADDETHLEVFYRLALNDKLSLTPDIQVIGNNGGDSTSDTVTVYGIRGQVNF